MALVLDGDNGIVGVLVTNTDGDVTIDTNTFFVDADNNRVGIGTTSPGETLEVNGNMFINVASGNPNLTIKTAGAGNNPFARLQADSTYWDILGAFSSADDPLHFQYGGSDKMILTNGGTLGLGVTPGSWSANYPALQIGGGATFTGHAGNTQTQLGQNWWVGTGNQYVVDGAASRLIMNPDSTIKFTQAPSGTAGATMSTTYDRLTIDPSGNVGIGISSGNNEKLTVAGAISATASSANFTAGPERVFMDIAAGENAVRFGHLQGTTSAARDIKFISGNVTRMTMYSAGKLGINTQPDSGTLEVIALTDNPALLVTNSDLTHTSSAYWSNRNNRTLTSNGTNWAIDGRDPAIVVGSHNDGTDKGEGLGILLHNESTTNNTFSPGLYFTNKSNSGIYNTAYGYIMGRKTGQGVDANWSTGEVWIDTAGTKHNGNNQYMDDSPAIRVRSTGTVDMRWQAFSYGTLSGNTHQTYNTGWGLSPQLTQGLNYNNNSSHGWGFTVNEEGYYECMATGLYDDGSSGYVYIGWALNGSQQHHWHSNHGIESNHDFVSHMTRWCNVGDHITIEHSSAPVSYQWGGAHSQYSIWKVG